MPAGSVAVPTIIPLKAPSGSKWTVDATTQIELRSATSGATVYYTLGGGKPDPFQHRGQGRGRGTTFAYSGPFTLAPGRRVTIRAVALSHDRLHLSAVVTKHFSVEAVPDGGNVCFTGEEEIDGRGPSSPSPQPTSPLSTRLRERLRVAARANSATEGGTSPGGPAVPPPTIPFLPSSPAPPGNAPTRQTASSPTARLRAKDKPEPVCVYCNAPRPRDSDYKYCSQCGSRQPPLPPRDDPAPLQMSACLDCRALMPPDASVCLVCEAPVTRPDPLPTILAQTQALQSGGDKLPCLSCGTLNQQSASLCVTCEASLPSHPPLLSPPSSPPPPLPPLPTPTTIHPVHGSSYLLCGTCGRVNVSDARFCDWCGGKPQCSQLSVACPGCSAQTGWHSRHCSSCGELIKAPLRKGVEVDSTMKMPGGVAVPRNAWVPVVELEPRGPATHTVATDTRDLFYPSARTMSDKKGAELVQKAIRTMSRDRVVKLDTWSPGKTGLWRAQVEHVCSHLRAHCKGCPDLQASIGKPHMGKLMQAEVETDEDEERVRIHLTFSLKKNDGSNSSLPLRSQSTVAVSGQHSGLIQDNSHQVTKQKQRLAASKPSTTITQLMNELSQQGAGRRDLVEQLIKKGADVNAVGSNGLPLLSLAAAHGHLDCLQPLVEGGAKLNTQARRTGNTALHECVTRGPSRTGSIEALLGYGADARLKNRDGLTPCELAVMLKHNSVVACFATYVGAGLLGQLRKPQPNLTL